MDPINNKGEPHSQLSECNTLESRNITLARSQVLSYGITRDDHLDVVKQISSACEDINKTKSLIRDESLAAQNDKSVIENLLQKTNVTLNRVLALVKDKDKIKIFHPDEAGTSLSIDRFENYDRLVDNRNDSTLYKQVSKEWINSVIKTSLNNCLSLKAINDVLDVLEAALDGPLTQDDKNYIQSEYLGQLVELWLDEVSENVTRIFDISTPCKLIDELNSVKDLMGCLTLGFDTPYNSLLKDLCKDEVLTVPVEKKLITNFKITILTFMRLKTGYFRGESDFHQSLIRVLKLSKNVQHVCDTLNVNIFLESLKDENISFRKFLEEIINCSTKEEPFTQLKASARSIVTQETYFLVRYVKETIRDYLKPFVLNESYKEGRKLLEVTGEHIVVSEVLPKILSRSNFNEIEEVRFVKAGVLHINESICHTLWHGKNIVVYADSVIVSDEKNIVWDVSGSDAEDTIVAPAGTDTDGFGLKGDVGKPGESGGNVVLMCEEIENASNLKIVVSGGKGSRGQDGGKGKDGEDGEYITESTFKNEFPAVCKFWNSSKRENLEKLRASIMSDIESAEISVLGRLKSVTPNEFDYVLEERVIKPLNDTYFEVKTRSGCRILFSFYYGSIFSFCQSFLLHKGSDGEPGKPGGRGGFGGRGGCPGEVIIQVSQNSDLPIQGIEVCANRGEDGKLGEPGEPGRPGKSGKDCAHIDSTLMSKPKYFTTVSQDSQRLTVKYHKQKGTDRVYCYHNDQYAQIVRVEKDFYQSSKMNYKSNNNTMEESQSDLFQVIRKKTININDILENYERKTSTANFQKSNNFEQKINQVFEEILDEEELQRQTENQLKITRKIQSPNDDRLKVYLEPTPFTSYQDTSRDLNSKDQHMKLLMNSPMDITGWKVLTQIHLSLEEVRCLFTTINLQSSSVPEYEVQSVLRNKYHLAALEYMQKLIFEEQTSFDNRQKTINPKLVGSIQNCLIEPNDCNIKQYEVEGYLYEDSDIKRKTIINNVLSSPSKKLLMDTLFLNYGHIFLPEDKIVSYKNQCDELKHEKAENMNEKILPVLSNLKKGQTCQMYEELVGCVNSEDINAKLNLENIINNDELLRKCFNTYKREVEELKSELLTKEYLTSEIENKMIDDIKDKGALSVFYRELLAQYFNTNIQVYTIDNMNEMTLKNNHNPSADVTIHVLLRRNELFKLKVDENLWKMNRLHEEKSKICNQIQLHIASITEKVQFDQFVKDIPLPDKAYNAASKSEEINMKINHILMEDENIQSITNCFQHDEDKTLIFTRIKMLKHEYVGYQSALHYIAMHLKFEGNHLTALQLSCVISFILKSLLMSPSKMHLVYWILATCHQTNWLTEFTLLKLELYFKQLLEKEVKIKWRECLNKTNRESLMVFLEKLFRDQTLDSIEGVDEILFLLSNVPHNDSRLPKLCLAEWKYLLKDAFWICQVNSIGSWSEDQLRNASYYLMTLENLVGSDICKRVLEVAKNNISQGETEDRKNALLIALRQLTRKETLATESLINFLYKEDINKWEAIIEGEAFSSTETRSQNQLIHLVKNSGNTSEGILTKIDDIESCIVKTNSLFKFLITKIEDKIKLQKFIKDLLNLRNDLFLPGKEQKTTLEISDQTFKNVLQEMKQSFDKHKGVNSKKSCAIEEHFQDISDFLISNFNEILLATVRAMIYFVFDKIELRSTQILAILTFLKADRNVLGQVSTGEGKSFIIISVAILKALSGCKVDIVTSSHVLAKRDAEAYKHLCELFDIEVGHNCSENIEERKRAYSNCPIVYGELAYYQRDYLLDRVYNNNILGDREFETVLVDEVDSMLLDKGNNVLYLSHEIPGLDKLEPLFVHIWKCLNLPFTPTNDELHSIEQLKSTILRELYDEVKVEDIRDLDPSLGGRSVRQTWEHLHKEGVIDLTGKIVKNNLSKLDEVAKGCDHGSHIIYLFNKIINRTKAFEIPVYLKSFVEDHLEEWIESAIHALNLKVDKDYVVDIDRSVDSADRQPNIIILDRDTGTDMTNSHWDQGLHQFLQLKHGCRVSPLSFKAVFISNVKYLKQYKTLCGLTGTLGSTRDRDLLKEKYEVEFVTIPTAKAKAFNELIPMLCDSSEEWSSKIFETVYSVTEKRSALIICESVNDVLFLRKNFDVYLKNKTSTRHIYTYTRDYEKFSIAEHVEPGRIIISTNLAGRGTDIKLSKELVDAGGLHVCLSFLPNNNRVEEQAFGRAARNGEPGTGQLIFRNIGGKTASKVIDLKKERDLHEVFRISEIKEYYDTTIKLEENWFSGFQKMYRDLRNSSHCSEIKSLLLMTCLDQWAIWLEKAKNKEVAHDSLQSLIDNLTKLKDTDFEVWSSQITDPFHLTKLGLLYLKQQNYEKAKLLFDRVIKEEPVFNEAAYYYRACAMSYLDDMDSKDLVEELKIVEKKLKERIECSLLSARFIDWLKTSNKKKILQINSFEEQQKTKSKTYEIFMGSIQNIIGHPVTPESFLAITQMPFPGFSDGRVSNILFNDLIEHEIIDQRINKNVSESDLKFFSEYGLCPEKMRNILESCVQKHSVENIKQWLKESTELPSRELFWNELKSTGILTNEVQLAVINYQTLKEVDPSLAKKIQNLPNNSPLKGQISLYSLKELGQLGESIPIQCFYQSTLEKEVGLEKINLLKQSDIIQLNKLATIFKPVDAVEFNYFDSIAQEDFLKVGISADTSACIIKDLVSQKIICAKERDQSKYSLSINWEDIEKIQLKTHRAYLNDVKQLLTHCFAFRIALQKLLCVLPDCKENYNDLFLPLQINLDKRLWYELQSSGIVERTINVEAIKSVDDVYPESAVKDTFVKIFSKVYNENQSEEIVEELVKKNWLKSNIINNNLSINHKRVKDNQKETIHLIKPSALSPSLKGESETIELILLSHLYFSSNTKVVKDRLKCLKAGIHDVETASFSLRSLETVLHQLRVPTTEVNTFALNGFDEVVYLQEKKYTKRMRIWTFCITMLGVLEIAVGSFLELVFLGSPLGLYFISQGVDDLVFATQCLYTGQFSWTDYRAAKLVSLITSSATCLKAFSQVGASSFATKTAGISVTSLKDNCFAVTSFKDKCVSLLSRAKSTIGNIFKSEATKPVTKGKIISHLCKRVVTHTAQGIASGATFAFVDHIVKSRIDDLGEMLTDVIFSDIDEAVYKHPAISEAIELSNILGTEVTLKVVERSLVKVISRHQNKLDTSFDSINLRMMKNLIERTTSKEFRKDGFDISDLSQIASATANVSKAIMSARSYFLSISKVVSEILNEVHLELESEKNNPTMVRISLKNSKSDLKDFEDDVFSLLQSTIRECLMEHLQKKVVVPILEYAESCFTTYSFKIIGRVSKSFLTDDEIYRFSIRENTGNFKQKDVKESDNGNNCLYSDFNRISCELLKMRKNRSVLALQMLMSQNAPMDLYCLEFCFRMIPLALKQEGVKVPSLRLEFTDNGTTHVFEFGDTKEAPVVRISKDSDFMQNLKTNKLLIKDVLAFLSKSFYETHPELHDLTATLLLEIFFKTMDYFCDSHSCPEDFEEYAGASPTCGGTFNVESENKNPYQHSHCSGGWKFCPHVDVDIREKDAIINLNNIQSHIVKGFETAVRKINKHIHLIQDRIRHFNLVLDDFSATKHDLAPPPPDNTSEVFLCYTVQYELVVPVMLTGCDRLVDFAIVLRLENEKPLSKPKPRSPNGPHIVYEMNPVRDAKFMDKGLRGHILLNNECTRKSFSVKDCHSAGELIVASVPPKQKHSRKGQIKTRFNETRKECSATVPPKQKHSRKSQIKTRTNETRKECSVVIIADSLFKDINNHIKLSTKGNFEVFRNPYMRKVKRKITSWFNNYEGVKCVILFIGNDFVKQPNIQEAMVVNYILEVIEEIQKLMKNVQVVLYSLMYVKEPAMKNFWKIFNMNTTLKRYRMEKHFIFVDTNEVIGPQDLKQDGIHLEKSGYEKLGNHLSENCKQIVKI